MTSTTTCSLVDLAIDLASIPIGSQHPEVLKINELTKKFPTMRDGDHNRPSALSAGSYAHGEGNLTSPPLDPALLDAKNKDSATFDHSPTLRVVQSASDTRDNALSCCVDQA